MIDTHCHLDSERFNADRADVLARAWARGVNGIVVPAVAPESWGALLEWPEKDARIQVALGIHPQMLPQLSADEDGRHLADLDRLLGLGIAIAVGECGIDGPSSAGAPLERQLSVMAGHFDLAEKHALPILIHCFRLQPALIAFLKQRAPPPAGLLLHSYSGGAELAKFYADRGCHFSFAGPVTYAGARKPLESVRAIPLDRLMLETDAPDQAPHPHRGERSEPAYLRTICSSLATALGMPESELAELTRDNARRFFRSFA